VGSPRRRLAELSHELPVAARPRQQVRLDRSNTLIRVAPSGNLAWASYQWEFTAVVDGVPSSAFGHTTLIFEKRNDNWLIVHNHTSLVQASQAAAPATQPPAATPPKP